MSVQKPGEYQGERDREYSSYDKIICGMVSGIFRNLFGSSETGDCSLDTGSTSEAAAEVQAEKFQVHVHQSCVTGIFCKRTP